MTARSFFIVVFLSLTQFSEYSYALNQTGPVAGAMGGAGVAANDVAEQIYLNPAALAHSSGLAGGYFYQGGYTAPRSRDEFWSFSITDNTEGILFPGGAYVWQRQVSRPNALDYSELRAEFAGAVMLKNKISIGGSLFRVERKFENDSNLVLWDANLGMLFNPNPDYAIGAVVRNLARHSDAIDPSVRLNDEIVIGGHILFMEQFRGRLDIGRVMESNPDAEYNFHLGIESLLDAYMVFRAGYESDRVSDQSFYTLGAGFLGPRLKIDYAFKQNADESSGTLHSVDLRLPF